MPLLGDGVTFYPPSGTDWADGVVYPAGTPTPSTSVTVDSASGAVTVPTIELEEMEDSPIIERAEQGTLTHKFSVPYDEGINLIAVIGRGTLMTDLSGNETKVLSATLQRKKPNMAILTVVAESLSFDTPPDEFQITPVELGLNILKHPRYFSALQGANPTENALNQNVIRLLQDYFENANIDMRLRTEARLINSFGHLGSLLSNGNLNKSDPALQPYAPNSGDTTTIVPVAGTDLAKGAAIEIVQKYWRGEETPYVVGYQIVWSSYYRAPQYLNPGGYIEDPVGVTTSPAVPPYFWNPNYPNELFYQHQITDKFGIFNPQCYTDTGLDNGNVVISWLRKADQQEYQRTWFKVDRTWIGSAVGYFDPDFYAASFRPQIYTDYNINPSAPALIPQYHGVGGTW